MTKTTKNTINNQILIKKLNLSLLTKFRDFIKKNHSKNHIFVKSKKVLDYFYKNGKDYNFYLARHNQSTLGVQGYISFNKFDKKITKTAFLAYWRVSKSNIPGIGFRLFSKIKKLNFNFLGVVGINDNLISYHKWQGFKVGKLSHFYFVNNQYKGKKNLKYNTNKKFIIKKLKITKLNKKKIISIKKKIFEFQYPVKSNKYLIKRYLNNPFYNYFIYSLDNDNMQLILVFRLIKFNNTKIIKLVDLIGNDKLVKYIGSSLDLLLKKYEAEYLDFYSYGIKTQCLMSAGFKNRHTSKEIIPDHFEPFKKKNIEINYGFISKFKRNIRLCKGDGDMDRPSIVI